MKRLKMLIIVVLTIIFTLIISIVYIKKSDLKIRQEVATPEKEVEIPFEQNEKITRVEYSVLNKVVTTYIQALNKNNSIYISVDKNGKQIIQNRKINQNIINMLSENYLKKNSIANENLNEYVDLVSEQLLFVPIKMKGISKGNVKTYAVQGITINLDYELKDEINLIVNVDYLNRTFSVEPTFENYDEIKDINKVTNIEENDNNKYSNPSINIENIVKEYINNFKRITLAKPELVYKYLDEEYRKKRFGSVEDFKEYVEKNQDEIKKIYIDKYLVNTQNEYSQYIGKDKYDNMYIFNEKDPLDYTIMLDTYTINSESFEKEYNESKNEYKVKLNIDKWIKMLNNRDYKNAYKYLDETFRKDNFETEERFEEYMREKFPLHYKLNVGESDEVNEIYTQKIVLKDITGESNEEIENTVIMQLKDDYNFVMSFGIE